MNMMLLADEVVAEDEQSWFVSTLALEVPGWAWILIYVVLVVFLILLVVALYRWIRISRQKTVYKYRDGGAADGDTIYEIEHDENTPRERIVEKIVEVPVEKIVEVPVEKPAEPAPIEAYAVPQMMPAMIYFGGDYNGARAVYAEPAPAPEPEPEPAAKIYYASRRRSDRKWQLREPDVEGVKVFFTIEEIEAYVKSVNPVDPVEIVISRLDGTARRIVFNRKPEEKK